MKFKRHLNNHLISVTTSRSWDNARNNVIEKMQVQEKCSKHEVDVFFDKGIVSRERAWSLFAEKMQ